MCIKSPPADATQSYRSGDVNNTGTLTLKHCTFKPAITFLSTWGHQKQVDVTTFELVFANLSIQTPDWMFAPYVSAKPPDDFKLNINVVSLVGVELFCLSLVRTHNNWGYPAELQEQDHTSTAPLPAVWWIPSSPSPPLLLLYSAPPDSRSLKGSFLLGCNGEAWQEMWN